MNIKSLIIIFWAIILTSLLGGCIDISFETNNVEAPVKPTITATVQTFTKTITPSRVETSTPTQVATPTGTNTPDLTLIKGVEVIPLTLIDKSIPWLPLDKTARPGINYVGFNTLKPPFNNTLVRQAFAYAIDRHVIVDIAANTNYSDNPTAATILTPPQTLGRDLYGVVGANFDPQRAKKLLTEAGYSDTSLFPTVIFLVNRSGDTAPNARYNMASAMVDMWKRYLGVNVEVQTIRDFSEYNERLKTNPPDLFWIGWYADYNDPANFIGEIFNPNGDYLGKFNYGSFVNQEFSQVIDRAAVSTNPQERQNLYIQAEYILCESEAAIIPIYHSTYNVP